MIQKFSLLPLQNKHGNKINLPRDRSSIIKLSQYYLLISLVIPFCFRGTTCEMHVRTSSLIQQMRSIALWRTLKKSIETSNNTVSCVMCLYSADYMDHQRGKIYGTSLITLKTLPVEIFHSFQSFIDCIK